MLAVINGHDEAIADLLALGASVTLRDLDGRTAFQLACRKKGTPMAHYFPEFDATVRRDCLRISHSLITRKISTILGQSTS